MHPVPGEGTAPPAMHRRKPSPGSSPQKRITGPSASYSWRLYTAAIPWKISPTTRLKALFATVGALTQVLSHRQIGWNFLRDSRSRIRWSAGGMRRSSGGLPWILSPNGSPRQMQLKISLRVLTISRQVLSRNWPGNWYSTGCKYHPFWTTDCFGFT